MTKAASNPPKRPIINQGNRAAFDALCVYMRGLPPVQRPEDSRFRSEVLRQLALGPGSTREIAELLSVNVDEIEFCDEYV